MSLTITGLYAAALGILLILLRTLVTIERAKTGISILHQDNMTLAEKIRRHGNFVENVPHGLILLAVVEVAGASLGLLHAIGGLLLLSRLLHPFGLTQDNAAHPLRIFSGILGSLSMLLAIGYIGWGSISG